MASENPTRNFRTAVCRHFARGFCKMGKQCAFLHEEEFNTGENVDPNPKRVPCRHWQRGFCERGESCGFMHPRFPGSTAPHPGIVTPCHSGWKRSAPFQALPAAKAMRGGDVCRHFAKGFCALGAGCKFLHATRAAPILPLERCEQEAATYKKTKLCVFYVAGRCHRGEKCTFAHGDEELGTPQLPVYQAPRPVEVTEPPGGFKKTKLCQYFLTGSGCSKGELCTFAHGNEEIGTPQPRVQRLAAAPEPPPGGFKKTRLCQYYAAGSGCRKGALCTFAHGEHELGLPQPVSFKDEAELDQDMASWLHVAGLPKDRPENRMDDVLTDVEEWDARERELEDILVQLQPGLSLAA